MELLIAINPITKETVILREVASRRELTGASGAMNDQSVIKEAAKKLKVESFELAIVPGNLRFSVRPVSVFNIEPLDEQDEVADPKA